MADRRGPDFIGIGAQKCGTSWIGWVLNQHPQVMIRRKEISYFVRHFHRGYAWYERWFDERGDRKAGEITVSYLYSPRPDAARKQFYPKWNPRQQLLFWRWAPSAREEIAAHYPDAALFAILRNPIDRAWSHYWFWRRRKERIGKGGRVVPFRRMFEDDGRWIRSQGFYAAQLTPWLESFPRLGVFFYDDLKQDPKRLAREVYRCVGVDEDFEPDLDRRVNATDYEPMPSEEREHLVRVYRDDVERLGELTGRDCSHWLRAAR